MPKSVLDSHSAHLSLRERALPVTLDWIDGKNVKLLRVANHREAFRFKKFSQALSTIENINKACWIREEKRVRQNLRRLTSVTPTYSSRTLFKRTSDVCSKVSVHRESKVELPPCVPVQKAGESGEEEEEEEEEAPAAPAQSQQSSAMPSPRASIKGPSLPVLPSGPLTSLTPVAHDDVLSTTPSSSSSSLSSSWVPAGGSVSRKSSIFPSSLLMDAGGTEMGSPGLLLPTPSLLALLPPHMSPELHGLQEAVLGFPLLQKRVRDLMTWASELEQQRRERRSVALKPLEALRCRYLRLSESNINTLLQLCKESGVDVDIHPHMKDSDIDIATLFKSSSSSLDTTELL